MMELSREGSVFVLHMNDGENRMNEDFLAAFERALDEVEAARGVALVTRGEGKFYSNGIDLEWLMGAGADGAKRFVEGLERLYARLVACPVPTIAALNGHAFAGGAMLALAHDVRVMRTDRGYFCLPEVDINIPFTPGMSALVRAKMPNHIAHEAMVTGRRYTATEAEALGFVSATAEEAGVLPLALEHAGALAGKDAATLRTIKVNAYRDVLSLLEGDADADG